MRIFYVRLVIGLFYFSWQLHVFAQTSTDASATGISRAFNPAISVNALFSGMASDRDVPLWKECGVLPGFHCQCADVEITSNVDVYLQSKIVFGAGEDEGVELEEAYLTSLRLPVPIILRGGKMLNTFGRYNLYHVHHMAFAENPLILDQVFGPELNEVGMEVSYLVPLPWYSEVLGGILNGNNKYLFNSTRQGDFGYLAHMDNFLELTDQTSFRIGCSLLAGARGLHNARDVLFDSTITDITSRTWGVDFHLKWKPMQFGRYRSAVLEGEYVNTTLNIDSRRTGPLHGFYIQGLYQFRLRWWLQARYEWFDRSKELYGYFEDPSLVEVNNNRNFTAKRTSIACAYVPTEFSAYRLQYNRQTLGNKHEQQLVLQVNVTIGSHPAHKY